MKRTFFFVVIVVMALLIGCSNNAKIRNEEVQPYEMEFLESRKVTVIDEEYIGIFFYFTNNSGTTQTPDDLVRVEAFQNGVELTMTTFCGQKTEGAASCDMSIQDGATAKVVWLFTRDDDSEILVEVSDGQIFTIE